MASAGYGDHLKKEFPFKMRHSKVTASFAYFECPQRQSSVLELAFSMMEYSKDV